MPDPGAGVDAVRLDRAQTDDFGEGFQNGPRISFVIPARNEEGYIGRTVDQLSSARRRAGLAYEIVVVDGGSNDRTVELARAADTVVVGDPRASKNIASGRNVGASYATGEILFHTDADVIVPDIEALVAAVDAAFSDPKVVAATMPLRPYPWDCRLRDRVGHVAINAAVRLSVAVGGYVARGECQVVRASAFDRVEGYDETLALCEDGDLLHRLRAIGTVVYLPRHVVYHSPRRFRAQGYLPLLGRFAMEMFHQYALRRPYHVEWREVR